MKKSLIVLLVLCLVATSLFAGSFRVGADLGWGFDIYKEKYTASGSTEYNKQKIETDLNLSTIVKNNGFSANLVGEYEFTENWGLKVSAGMMFAGKAKIKFDGKVTVGGVSVDFIPEEMKESTVDDKSGMYFDFAVDGKYNFNISDKLSISGLAGVEMLLGNVYYDKDKTADAKKNLKNFAFGVNAGAEVSYMVIDNLHINGGVTAAWFFVNTCDMLKAYGLDEIPEGLSLKKSVNSFYIRPYVGATYAF